MLHCRKWLAALAAAASIQPASAQRADFLSDDMKGFVSVDAPVIAIQNLRVIDGTGAEANSGQTILVRDGRLHAIGPGVNIPSGAEVIDGAGLTALPGLVMMHEHLAAQSAPFHGVRSFPVEPSYLFLALANGVTSIRTAGGAPYEQLYVKNHVEAGRWIGPDIDITGSLNAPNPFFTGEVPLKTPGDVRNEVRHLAARGVTSFKVYFNMPRAHLRAGIKEAQKLGLKMAGHLCAVTVADAAELGLDSLEHGLWAITDFVPDKKPDECPEYEERIKSIQAVDPNSAATQALIRKMIESGMALTSTLAADHNAACPLDRPTARSVEMLSPRSRAAFEERLRECRSDAWQATHASEELATINAIMSFERAFAAAGGLVLAGADLMLGFGDHWQLEMMVEAGHTPLEAIKIATHNGALFQGQLEDIGTIESGKRANFFLVRGAPDQNIGEIRNVVTVFKDGVGYDSQLILEAMEGTVGR